MVAAGAKHLFLHDFVQTLFGFLVTGSNDDPFAQCKTVRLQHDGEACLLLQVLNSLLRVIKILISCGGNVVFLHEILGKGLATFQDRCIFTGSKSPQALCLQCIHQSADQGIIHAYDGQVNGLFLRKCHDLIKFHGSDGNTFCDLTDPGIARSTIDLIYFRTFCHTGCNGVLSATTAYDQYFHTHIFCLP